MANINRRRTSITIIIIVFLAILSGLASWHSSAIDEGGQGLNVPSWVPLADSWNKIDFHLGLDLKGGTHLLYRADTSSIESSDKESAVAGVRDVIEKRVNAFGVAEPIVQTNIVGDEYRLIVELAGVKDVDEAIQMIGETPLLEFKEQNPNYEENVSLTAEQQKELDDYNEEARKKAEDINKRALAGEDFGQLAREFSEDQGSKESGGELGWAQRGVFVAEFEKAIFDDLKTGEITAIPVKSQFGYHIIKKAEEREVAVEAAAQAEAITDEGEVIKIEGEKEDSNGDKMEKEVRATHILIATKTAADMVPAVDQWQNTELSGKHLKRSSVQYDQSTGDPEVSLEFNSEGADLFEQITERNVDKPVAIFLDGDPISVPNVREKITGGKAVISGRFNIQEAKELVNRLNAGALPVPITLISQQTVGPSLGRESVNKSLMAGLIGLLAVALFMIVYYRLPGLIATVALIIYTLFALAVFRLLPVTLTLAGVAGFIMSIGMAVDANVLIFERLKEESRQGRDFANAVEEGFKRAWPSIRDSNLSTLVTCFILYYFGTSVIRGFALTLIIGIVLHVFTAITTTRSIMRLLNSTKMGKIKWLYRG